MSSWGLRRRYWCHILAAAFSFGLLGPLAALVLDRESPVDILDTQIVPNPVRAGGTVIVTWTAVEKRACEGTVHRRWVDASGVVHETQLGPTVLRERGSLGRKTFARELRVPLGMAPGPAHYEGARYYVCNPTHHFWPIRVPIKPVRLMVER